MNDRRCHKCGGFVPAGNSVCNHCGQKIFTFGGSSLYVGSSKNANKLDTKENPFSDGKKNNGCVVFIFILIVLFPIIRSSLKVIFEEFEKEGLTFETLFEDMFDDDYYDEDYYYDEDVDNDEDDYVAKNSCNRSCNSSDFKSKNGYCFCSDGSVYDNYGINYYNGTGEEKEDLNARCELFCNEEAAYLGGACYCKNGNRYSTTADIIGKSDKVVIQNLLTDLENNENILIYGAGDGEGNYSFDEPMNPVRLNKFMNDYDYKVYYLDYDGIFPEAREELVSKYGIVDFSVPYYYLYRDGVAIKKGVFFHSLSNLKEVLDENANKEISQ